MEETERNNLLQALLDIGELMLDSGGEVKRVEDTIARMGMASGAARMNVFVITSSIVVTMEDSDGHVYTQTKRVLTSASNHFRRLEQLNQLSRAFCRKPCSCAQLHQKIEAIRNQKENVFWMYFGSMLGAMAFAIFFGGTFADGIASGLMGLLVAFLVQFLDPICPNAVSFNLLTSFLTGFCVCLTARLAPSLHADMIMIGDIMLLIPGIPMTNSIRDILVGDTISGTLRLTESMVRAAVIAAGFMTAIMAAGRL
ncbi:MAG: threonine/serine exporter family protein [Lactimicrobium sp.]|jgi:uncharacterized membrane protein YjjP (DUF1212 family)|uniref:threonine/serine exporter family protein n=1 Tax=Lactimicrobium sp. TaxID=2563780 RepID=UPI002F35972F